MVDQAPPPANVVADSALHLRKQQQWPCWLYLDCMPENFISMIDSRTHPRDQDGAMPGAPGPDKLPTTPWAW